jgi:uncharacterized membrane protein
MTKTAIGWRVYGLGVMALGLVDLAFGNFDSVSRCPRISLPHRAAYAVAAFMLVAGAAIAWRRTMAFGAAALTLYYALFVVIVMNGRVLLAHYDAYGAYIGIAEQLAIGAGGLIVYANGAKIEAVLAARLTRVGQATVGVCAVLFGVAHFFYMNLTAPLVPKWLPPSQEFWGYATGVFHIAAGVALLTKVQARLAAVLLTIMYALFTPLVHLPMALANQSKQFIVGECAESVLVGVAWVVADSYSIRSRS